MRFWKRLFELGVWLVAAVALCCSAWAQKGADRDSLVKARILGGKFPEKPSIVPAWTIPVDALGFAAPGAIYLGMRNTMVSLDFLGEDRLLFTFRIPGLQRREPGDNVASTARQIRAVILAVPTGAVQAQAQWTLHDRDRYLWMLNDGHFLVRDRNSLVEGDGSLALKPFLTYPGPLLTVDLNPDQQFLITNSNEPGPFSVESANASGAAKAQDDDSKNDDNGDEEDAVGQGNIVLRILRRDSARVMLATHVRSPVVLATNSQGYLGRLRGKGDHWVLQMSTFSGSSSKPLIDLESTCMPHLEFASEKEVLATSCMDNGSNYLTGVTTDGQTLWRDLFPEQAMWPILKMSPNGLRIARESIFVSHPVASFAPITSADIKGQWVRIFDAATGELALEAPSNPILDAGGNVAISPSGRRVALLGASGIQIFELPAPPPLPPAPAVGSEQ